MPVAAIATSVAVIGGLYATGASKPRDERRGATTFSGLLRQTEQVRELRFRSEVEPEYLTPDEMGEEMRLAVEEDEVFTGLPHQEVLHLTALLPEDVTLEEALGEATAAVVGGFYDPDTGRLAVLAPRADRLSPQARVTMVHELTHAVTDQHFDLGAFATGDEPADELIARIALVEGDATLAATMWQMEYLSFQEGLVAGLEGVGSAGDVAAIPPAISSALAFPYTDGLRFVQALQERGGWSAVDAAYRRPPTTTEQILHPEAYDSGEVGDEVEPPSAPAGFRPGSTGTVGELFLRVMLAGELSSLVAMLPGSAAGEAAAGWDGGAYRVSTRGRQTALTMELRWDSPGDAREFADALPGWFDNTFGKSEIVGEDTRESADRCLSASVDSTTVRVHLVDSRCDAPSSR